MRAGEQRNSLASSRPGDSRPLSDEQASLPSPSPPPAQTVHPRQSDKDPGLGWGLEGATRFWSSKHRRSSLRTAAQTKRGGLDTEVPFEHPTETLDTVYPPPWWMGRFFPLRRQSPNKDSVSDRCWPAVGIYEAPGRVRKLKPHGPFLAGSCPTVAHGCPALWSAAGLCPSGQGGDNETVSSFPRCHRLDTEGIDGLVTMGTRAADPIPSCGA